MPAPARHIGGHPWHAGAPKLPQITVHISREEVTALRSQDRLRRLNDEAQRGTRFQLLDSRGSKDPVVLITGVDPAAVTEAKIALSVLLHRGVDGLVVPLHLFDIRMLKGTRCELLAEIEEKSGCRIILEDHWKDVKTDINLGQKQPFVRLLGTQQGQARAVDLLARVCQKHVVSETMNSKLAGSGRALVLHTFDPIKRGENVDMTEDHAIARSRRTQGCWNPSHCVIAGMGAMDTFNAGAFFCLGIRKVESDRRFRGGMRFGISPIPVAMPLPDSLLFEPNNCWVLGRGLARSPGEKNKELYGASFDHFQEGDELGLIVTSQRGSVAVLHRPLGRQWTCLVHWDAQIPHPRDALFVLVDLAGGLEEVEVRVREPPIEPLGDAVSLPHRTPLLDRTQRFPKPRRIQREESEECPTAAMTWPQGQNFNIRPDSTAESQAWTRPVSSDRVSRVVPMSADSEQVAENLCSGLLTEAMQVHAEVADDPSLMQLQAVTPAVTVTPAQTPAPDCSHGRHQGPEDGLDPTLLGDPMFEWKEGDQ